MRELLAAVVPRSVSFFPIGGHSLLLRLKRYVPGVRESVLSLSEEQLKLAAPVADASKKGGFLHRRGHTVLAEGDAGGLVAPVWEFRCGRDKDLLARLQVRGGRGLKCN